MHVALVWHADVQSVTTAPHIRIVPWWCFLVPGFFISPRKVAAPIVSDQRSVAIAYAECVHVCMNPSHT